MQQHGAKCTIDQATAKAILPSLLAGTGCRTTALPNNATRCCGQTTCPLCMVLNSAYHASMTAGQIRWPPLPFAGLVLGRRNCALCCRAAALSCQTLVCLSVCPDGWLALISGSRGPITPWKACVAIAIFPVGHEGFRIRPHSGQSDGADGDRCLDCRVKLT